MAKLIERQFTSKEKEKELKELKLKFSRHFKVEDYFSDIFYTEVRAMIRLSKENEETEMFKRYGLDK